MKVIIMKLKEFWEKNGLSKINVINTLSNGKTSVIDIIVGNHTNIFPSLIVKWTNKKYWMWINSLKIISSTDLIPRSFE